MYAHLRVKVVLRPHLLIRAGKCHQVSVVQLQLVQDLLVGAIHSGLELLNQRVCLPIQEQV